jgi:prophage tail gpP-like protein
MVKPIIIEDMENYYKEMVKDIELNKHRPIIVVFESIEDLKNFENSD